MLQAVEQPVEPGLGWLVGSEAEGPLKEFDGRVQRRVLVLRRAAPLDDRRVRLSFDHPPQDVLLQRMHEARLAQARLADEQDDLAHALEGLLPALLQKADLVVAAGEWREPDRPRHLDRVAYRGDSSYPE